MGHDPVVGLVDLCGAGRLRRLGRVEQRVDCGCQRTRIANAKNLNNSDMDFCEWQGRLVINYSWGNQQGVEHLAEAIYDGNEAQFLRGWFPGVK